MLAQLLVEVFRTNIYSSVIPGTARPVTSLTDSQVVISKSCYVYPKPGLCPPHYNISPVSGVGWVVRQSTQISEAHVVGTQEVSQTSSTADLFCFLTLCQTDQFSPRTIIMAADVNQSDGPCLNLTLLIILQEGKTIQLSSCDQLATMAVETGGRDQNQQLQVTENLVKTYHPASPSPLSHCASPNFRAVCLNNRNITGLIRSKLLPVGKLQREDVVQKREPALSQTRAARDRRRTDQRDYRLTKGRTGKKLMGATLHVEAQSPQLTAILF
ncbi:hypothetical protein RRG08_016794 [Elysia crispata]|uniref:Uncharacterized protein n=1 Tax=Elysia crispata TaxID=231223 RepID=A0AAE0ZZH5_9GAST|nr:hypothetical protein RRG08_016794 [Elysia crispata]